MNFTEDFTTNEFVFDDGTRVPFTPIIGKNEQEKAMLKWASRYIDILEWNK